MLLVRIQTKSIIMKKNIYLYIFISLIFAANTFIQCIQVWDKETLFPFGGGQGFKAAPRSVETATNTNPKIYFAGHVRWPGAVQPDPNVKSKEQKDLESHLLRFTQVAQRTHRQHHITLDPIALKQLNAKDKPRKISAIQDWYEADPDIQHPKRIDDLARFVEATDWAASCASASDGTEPTICHGPVKPLEPGEEETPPEPKPGPKDGWGVKYINPTWVLPVNHNAPDAAKFFDPSSKANPLHIKNEGEGGTDGTDTGEGSAGEEAKEEPPQDAQEEAAKEEEQKEEEQKEEEHKEEEQKEEEQKEEEHKEEEQKEAANNEGGKEQTPPPEEAEKMPKDDLTQKAIVTVRDDARAELDLPLPERERTSAENPHYSHSSGAPPLRKDQVHKATLPHQSDTQHVGPLTYSNNF